MGVRFTGNASLFVKTNIQLKFSVTCSYLNGKWIKLPVVKSMTLTSKLNMYPDVLNAEPLHHIYH